METSKADAPAAAPASSAAASSSLKRAGYGPARGEFDPKDYKVDSDTEYDDMLDIESYPPCFKVEMSGKPSCNGIYRRMPVKCRGRPAFVMQDKKKLTYLYYHKKKWVIGQEFGSRKFQLKVKEVEGIAPPLLPLEPYPFAWSAYIQQEVKEESSWKPVECMRVAIIHKDDPEDEMPVIIASAGGADEAAKKEHHASKKKRKSPTEGAEAEAQTAEAEVKKSKSSKAKRKEDGSSPSAGSAAAAGASAATSSKGEASASSGAKAGSAAGGSAGAAASTASPAKDGDGGSSDDSDSESSSSSSEGGSGGSDTDTEAPPQAAAKAASRSSPGAAAAAKAAAARDQKASPEATRQAWKDKLIQQLSRIDAKARKEKLAQLRNIMFEKPDTILKAVPGSSIDVVKKMVDDVERQVNESASGASNASRGAQNGASHSQAPSVPPSLLPHRTSEPKRSSMKGKGARVLLKGTKINFDNTVDLKNIRSHKALGEALWITAPGSRVMCDNCEQWMDMGNGQLQRSGTEAPRTPNGESSQFVSDQWVCFNCLNRNGIYPPQQQLHHQQHFGQQMMYGQQEHYGYHQRSW